MSIDKFLKPKSKEEIENTVNSLSGKELMDFAISHDDLNYAKMALEKNDKNTIIEDSELEFLMHGNKWKSIIDGYIQLKLNHNLASSLRVAMLTHKPFEYIENILNSLNIDFAKMPDSTSNRYNVGFIVMKWAITYLKTFDEIKIFYNNPKIKGKPNFQYELTDLLLKRSDIVKNSLDLLLSDDNKLVKESIDDVLKPKNTIDVANAQKYYSDVFFNMMEIGQNLANVIKDDDLFDDVLTMFDEIQMLFHKSASLIKDNFYKNVLPDETARQIFNHYSLNHLL